MRRQKYMYVYMATTALMIPTHDIYGEKVDDVSLLGIFSTYEEALQEIKDDYMIYKNPYPNADMSLYKIKSYAPYRVEKWSVGKGSCVCGITRFTLEEMKVLTTHTPIIPDIGSASKG